MSIIALFARVSHRVLDRSVQQISQRKKSQRLNSPSGSAERMVSSAEVMEQRVLLDGHAELLDGLNMQEIHGIPAYEPDFIGPQPSELAAASTVEGVPPFDEDDTFFLHSKPDATKVIYLDFDGHITNDPAGDQTGWNGGQRVDSPAYDLDGDIFTFNDQELENIQRIWQQVVEDFIPFDVDVTTEEPSIEDLRRRDGYDSSLTYVISNEVDDGSIPLALDTQIISGQVS